MEDFIFNFYKAWIDYLFDGLNYVVIRGRQKGNPPQPLRPFVMIDIQDIPPLASRKDTITTNIQIGTKFKKVIFQQYEANVQVVFFSDNSVSDAINFEISQADENVLQIAYNNGISVMDTRKIPDSSSLAGPDFQSVSVFDSNIMFSFGREINVDAIEGIEFTQNNT